MKPWEKNVRKVVPYVPGEQPNQIGMIKLNTNENPYPPAPGVREAIKNLESDRMRLYPDPTADLLVSELADFYHLDKDQIFVGVGSDDVLAMCFLTFFNSQRPIFFPDITYSFYDVWADVFRIPYECQPLDENFAIVKEDYYKPNGGVVFPNPNAPTGIGQNLSDIEDIIRHNQDVVVIVDEAYIDFGGQSALELIDRYENLLVVQTFSKSRSLAGVRIGYAFGNRTLIKYLNDVKYSFNSYTMNYPSLVIGRAALADRAYFEDTKARIIATRERVKGELSELGFTFGDSQSNFLFITHEKVAARELFEALKIKRIYVRYFNKPRIDNYLRVTIGTEEEMDALLAFLRKYLQEKETEASGENA
ncbi:MAG: histidinol-phosphate transaminase [Firmicutes bacterium]|nr:histidinol-phosphate transaminase [Bacillota bacterium]MDY2819847.1 histidinol-phosphate transaminase [Hominisplanchenecus sp.]